MEDNLSEEERKKQYEKELILRKSLLRGQSSKIARDNIKLRENIKKMAKNFLKLGGNHDQKSSG
jgi:hypothetical protein